MIAAELQPHLAQRFLLLDQSDQPVTAVHPRFLDTPPDIILSESFDHPPAK